MRQSTDTPIRLLETADAFNARIPTREEASEIPGLILLLMTLVFATGFFWGSLLAGWADLLGLTIALTLLTAAAALLASGLLAARPWGTIALAIVRRILLWGTALAVLGLTSLAVAMVFQEVPTGVKIGFMLVASLSALASGLATTALLAPLVTTKRSLTTGTSIYLIQMCVSLSFVTAVTSTAVGKPRPGSYRLGAPLRRHRRLDRRSRRRRYPLNGARDPQGGHGPPERPQAGLLRPARTRY